MSVDVIAALRAALVDAKAGAILTDPSDRQPYERGWRYGQGVARAVVRPSTVEEVAAVLRICGERGVPVQPIGANTGLVGASNPDESGECVALSMERLAARVDVDPIDRTATVDSGVTLSQLNAALAAHDLWFPIDLGADPQLGGMVVTNTGGTSLLRYGDVRRNLLGVEVALADGSVLSMLDPLRKNNTGLDLTQLFVGTSGVLGVVTKVVVEVRPRPRQRATALVSCAGGAAVLALLQRLERELGEFLAVFEAISGAAWAATLRHGANLRDPFGGAVPGYAVLVELASTMASEHLDLEDRLQATLIDVVEQGVPGIDDVVPDATGLGWAIRHQISESLAREGVVLGLDLSVPRARLAEFSDAARALVDAEFGFARVCDFGHWGDGGTHLNVIWEAGAGPQPDAEVKRAIQARLYELCVRGFGGSFSAEHGIGPHNLAYVERFGSPWQRRAVDALRDLFDPGQLLGRHFPRGRQ